MKTKKNSKGFVCVLDTPSLEGLVYIGACTEDPSNGNKWKAVDDARMVMVIRNVIGI